MSAVARHVITERTLILLPNSDNIHRFDIVPEMEIAKRLKHDSVRLEVLLELLQVVNGQSPAGGNLGATCAFGVVHVALL